MTPHNRKGTLAAAVFLAAALTVALGSWNLPLKKISLKNLDQSYPDTEEFCVVYPSWGKQEPEPTYLDITAGNTWAADTACKDCGVSGAQGKFKCTSPTCSAALVSEFSVPNYPLGGRVQFDKAKGYRKSKANFELDG